VSEAEEVRIVVPSGDLRGIRWRGKEDSKGSGTIERF